MLTSNHCVHVWCTTRKPEYLYGHLDIIPSVPQTAYLIFAGNSKRTCTFGSAKRSVYICWARTEVKRRPAARVTYPVAYSGVVDCNESHSGNNRLYRIIDNRVSGFACTANSIKKLYIDYTKWNRDLQCMNYKLSWFFYEFLWNFG